MADLMRGVANQASGGNFPDILKLLFGSPESQQIISRLGPEQQQQFQQLMQALSGQGAGGAFGDTADYYRSLLDPNSDAAAAAEAPLLRQFQQQTIPGLAEQFAGMGSGAVDSSGFKNAATGAGVDLTERLAAMRAGLRQQGAAGLTGLGQMGLQQNQDVLLRPQTYGLVGNFLEGVSGKAGQAIGSNFGGQFNKVFG